MSSFGVSGPGQGLQRFPSDTRVEYFQETSKPSGHGRKCWSDPRVIWRIIVSSSNPREMKNGYSSEDKP